MALKKELLSVLACPACKGDLAYDAKKEVLHCAKCKKSYSVRKGIPVFI